MRISIPTLFDEVSAKLPLFEDLSQDALERLTIAGLGRGLLTASVRARLRRAGFVDMGALALATPADLMRVRKIGPVRTNAIRDHLLREIVRLYPGTREFHTAEATGARRMDRLGAIPANSLPIEESEIEALGFAGADCAALASCGRSDVLRTRSITASDLDRVIVTLVRFLWRDRPRPARDVSATESDPDAEELLGKERRERAIQERDREWEAAAPSAQDRN